MASSPGSVKLPVLHTHTTPYQVCGRLNRRETTACAPNLSLSLSFSLMNKIRNHISPKTKTSSPSEDSSFGLLAPATPSNPRLPTPNPFPAYHSTS